MNKKIYIGQSNNLKKRKREHFNKLRKDTHENSYLQRAFNKYGEQCFQYEVLVEENLSDEELDKLEYIYIQLFGSHLHTQGKGYNLSIGGKTRRGFKHTPKTIEKMSKSRTGEKNGFYGKKHTKESIERRLANMDYSFAQTKEHRQKISESMKGRKFTDEHRLNKSNAQRGGKNPIAKKVSVEGVVYECIQDVARHYGLRHNTVSYRLKSTSETFREWFYLNNLNA